VLLMCNILLRVNLTDVPPRHCISYKMLIAVLGRLAANE
jgi:hypothetical protein